MNELIWRSEDEMQAELKTIADTRDYNIYGCDGHVRAATGVFEYKRIKYIINVLRYYILANPNRPNGRVSKFCPMGHRKSEYFANLEYPEESESIVKLVKQIREYSEFLYNDSLHMYADDMDINEQIESMHQRAREDIDSLEKLDEEIDVKIKELEAVKQQVRNALL